MIGTAREANKALVAAMAVSRLSESKCRLVSFTGPRTGMTDAQADSLVILLTRRDSWEELIGKVDPWLHHGDCQGSDERAHAIAQSLGWLIGLHPPLNPSKRAFCRGATRVYPPLDYIPRDHALVDATTELIATPKGPEIPRSGTWATIRYARRQLKMITIIHPDGSVEFNP